MIEIQDGYFLEKDGSVYSSRKFSKKTKLKQHKDNVGYFRVTIGNPRVTHKVHRLVAQTFISNPENKPHVNHIDGNKTNNHVDNLEWCTASENIQHAYDTGLKKPYTGLKDKGNNKFYKEWDKLIKNGESMRSIGKRYGVSHRTVGNVVKKYNNLKIN